MAQCMSLIYTDTQTHSHAVPHTATRLYMLSSPASGLYLNRKDGALVLQVHNSHGRVGDPLGLFSERF